MSRRAKPRREEARPAATPEPRRRPGGSSLVAQVGLLVAVFAVVTLIAELAGAANLGVSLGVGQIAFAIVLVALLARG